MMKYNFFVVTLIFGLMFLGVVGAETIISDDVWYMNDANVFESNIRQGTFISVDLNRTNLRETLQNITDASEEKPYFVMVHGAGDDADIPLKNNVDIIGYGAVIRLRDSANTNLFVSPLNSRIENITIEGLQVNGNKDSQTADHACFNFSYQGYHLSFVNNEVYNCAGSPLSIEDAWRGTVRGNTFRYNDDYILIGQHINFLDNEITNNKGGLTKHPDHSDGLFHNQIAGNLFLYNEEWGIYNISESWISNNGFYNNSNGSIYLRSDNILTGGIVEASAREGLRIEGDRNLISNVLFKINNEDNPYATGQWHDPHDYQIYIMSGSNFNQFRGNTVSNEVFAGNRVGSDFGIYDNGTATYIEETKTNLDNVTHNVQINALIKESSTVDRRWNFKSKLSSSLNLVDYATNNPVVRLQHNNGLGGFVTLYDLANNQGTLIKGYVSSGYIADFGGTVRLPAITNNSGSNIAVMDYLNISYYAPVSGSGADYAIINQQGSTNQRLYIADGGGVDGGYLAAEFSTNDFAAKDSIIFNQSGGELYLTFRYSNNTDISCTPSGTDWVCV